MSLIDGVSHGLPPSPQVPGAGPVSLWRPVHVGPLAGRVDGVAAAVRLAPHPAQAAAGEAELHRELHGVAHREVDQLPNTRESGKDTFRGLFVCL